MGFTIMPICKHCGYKTESISIGGGRMNYLTVCGAPALNIENNEIETINLYNYKKTIVIRKKFLYFFNRKVIVEKINDKYVPYYEPKMFIEDKEIGTHNWHDKHYKKSKNYCPKCKTFNLDFVDGGIMFD
jgi:hypothetical protein